MFKNEKETTFSYYELKFMLNPNLAEPSVEFSINQNIEKDEKNEKKVTRVECLLVQTK